MRVLKWILMLVGAVVVFTALLLVVAYLTAGNPEPVLKTVTDDPSLPRIEFDDVVLHSEAFGEDGRPVIVTLHGGPGNDYRSILPLKQLSDRYKVVFYDQRGSGLSERVSADDISLEKYYLDLERVIDRYAPGQSVHLIGHSWGGMLASGYLGRHPERVDSIILIEPGMLNSETGALFMQKTNSMMPDMGFEVLKSLTFAWFESLHIDGPDPQAPMDYLSRSIMTADLPGHPLAGYFCGGSLKNGVLDDWRFGSLAASTLLSQGFNDQNEFVLNFAQGVEQFDKEVLILAGECNSVIGGEHQRLHQKLFKKAKLVVLEGVGHTMVGENPELVLTTIREHLVETPPLEAADEESE